MKRTTTCLAMVATALLVSGPGLAADQLRERDQLQEQLQDRDRVFGWELMTVQERSQLRERLQLANTEQEREQIRLENHQQMQERARQMGVTLPDEPRQGQGAGGFGSGGGKGGGGGKR